MAQLTPAEGLLTDIPALAEGPVPFTLSGSGERFFLRSVSGLGEIDGEYVPATGSGSVRAQLQSGDGTADVGLDFSAADGVSGQLSSAGLRSEEHTSGLQSRV